MQQREQIALMFAAWQQAAKDRLSKWIIWFCTCIRRCPPAVLFNWRAFSSPPIYTLFVFLFFFVFFLTIVYCLLSMQYLSLFHLLLVTKLGLGFRVSPSHFAGALVIVLMLRCHAERQTHSSLRWKLCSGAIFDPLYWNTLWTQNHTDKIFKLILHCRKRSWCDAISGVTCFPPQLIKH